MKTFHIGGVHPAENKLSAGSPIREAGLPKQAVISMFQHIGAPAVPVVKKGDEVKVGTMVGEPGKGLSVPIFSGVSGKVKSLTRTIRCPALAVCFQETIFMGS